MNINIVLSDSDSFAAVWGDQCPGYYNIYVEEWPFPCPYAQCISIHAYVTVKGPSIYYA
jgi:hypothetical protein